MKTNYVLVDFENVQPRNVDLLKGGPFRVKVFLGASQARIPLETARALQSFGPDAEYIQIDGNGSNALDFHIAYYIGCLAAEDSGAYFHIISKDTGFDPLIRHLKQQGILCQRWKSIADIPLIRISASASIAEKVDAVAENLAKRKAGRPKTLKTLRSTILALFLNGLGDGDLDEIIAHLSNRGVVKVVDGKVHYEQAGSA